ncbi:MAG: CHAT domain-containing protein [Myxococcota bacterium]
MDATYYHLDVSIYRVGESYLLELSHRDSRSQAQIAPVRGSVAFDLAELLELQGNHDDYGEALWRQLFCDEAVAQHFVRVKTAAEASGSFLRISVRVDPSAQELQALRWELLRDPQSHAWLSTSHKILLSRFMASRDFRPVKLRAKDELRVLLVVSAPAPVSLQRLRLAPVDFEGEVGRMRAVLDGMKVDVLGGPQAPVTVDRLLQHLRDGIDIVYLVSHGMFGRRSDTPALILQDDAGEAAVVKGETLAERIAELQRGPRLMVLASCQSAGDGEVTANAQRTTAQATLAGRLADAGVPGVLAMQGFISMDTVATMMPVFFAELLRDGQIDRALAVARGRVRDRTDAWMPALFTRLTSGRLWYTKGFTGGQGKDVWRRLLAPVARGKVVPIIGPRLLEAAYGSSHDTAMRLAGAKHYPMAAYEWDDLPRVTEYISVKESRFNVIQAYRDQLLRDLIEQHRDWLPPEQIPPANPKPKLGKLLSLVGEHLRQRTNDPYGILAELCASVYVTTNFDPLLEWALEAGGKTPQQVRTAWRYKRKPASADALKVEIPSAKAPVVYHAFGAFGPKANDGLVLTENDYFDYLIRSNAAQLMPTEVESALVDNSLLFVGFRLTDWHFRVLFRLMMSLPGREKLRDYCHVAVQLDPDLQTMADVDGAKAYLEEYFGKEANIDIFWGSAEDFLCALRDALAAAGELHADDGSSDDDDDEWGVGGR